MKKTPLQLMIEHEAVRSNDLSHQQYGRLWDAYTQSCDLLSRLAEHGGGDSDGEALHGPERLSLTANMLQDCFIVEQLISFGYYVVAIAVLRQQMETLARIIELRKGIQPKRGKPPNVRDLPFNLSHNYGRLSQIFHTTYGEYLAPFAEVIDDEKIASFLPVFRPDWGPILLAIHVAHLVTLAREIHLLQSVLYSTPGPVINEAVNSIADILRETGFWERFDQDL